MKMAKQIKWNPENQNHSLRVNDKNQQDDLVNFLYHAHASNKALITFQTSNADKVLQCNELFLKTFGIASAMLPDLLLHEIFENEIQFVKFKEEVIANKSVLDTQIEFKGEDGNTITGKVDCHLHTDSNGEPFFYWLILDISEQLKLQSQLQLKNAQLVKVSAQMEKFLYSTSHDLRSPLTSILGLVNLIKLEMRDVNVMDYVNRIEKSTLKLDQTIRDIMNLSKSIYQRNLTERINFESLIGRIIESYRVDPNFKLIQFEVVVKEHATFYTDTERIEIVLDALIRNCIHFVDINKTRPFVRITVTVVEEEAIIEIFDNGIGIGKDHFNSIFNMFYKASTHSRGAGLGLYIVKEGVEQLKGTIGVDSAVGFGTQFTMAIPNTHKGRLKSRKLKLQGGK